MAQQDVWPALGHDPVTMDDGITIVTEDGASLTVTAELERKIAAGILRTRDPRPSPVDEVDAPGSTIDIGVPLTVVDLFTRAGSYQSQPVVANNYDTGKPHGGGMFRWDGASVDTHNGGTVVGLSGVGRWKRIFSGWVTPEMFGAVGDGETDDTAALQAAVNACRRVVGDPAASYRVRDPVTSTAAGQMLEGPCVVVFDRAALGTGVSALRFTGDFATVSRVRFVPYTNPGLGGLVVDPGAPQALPYCIHINADHAAVEACHFAQGVPNGIYFDGDGSKRIRVQNCSGQGMSDGLSQDSSDHLMMLIDDGENCIITDNYGKNWNQVILTGNSTNYSTFRGNIGEDCGNHTLYVSSGDHVIATGNIGRGDYTDVKVRGDYSIVSGNATYGGTVSATSRQANASGTTFGLNAAVVVGNNVSCNRTGAYALNVNSVSGADDDARNIVIASNAIECRAVDVQYGVLVNAATVTDVAVVGNTVSTPNAPVDGILVAASAGAVASGNRLVVVANCVGNATAQGIQAHGDKVTIVGNCVVADGSTGTQSGAVVATANRATIMGNAIEATRASIPAVRARTGNYNSCRGNILNANGSTYVAMAGANDCDDHNIKADIASSGSAAYDPPSLADGDSVTTTVTVTGATLGDFASASFSNDLAGIALYAWVSAADTVSVRFDNETGGTINLANGTLRVRVSQRGIGP